MKQKISKWVSSPVSIIFLIYITVAILTLIIPSGEFLREVNPSTGVTEIQGDSFNYINKQYMNFLDFFRSIHLGFVDASDIIFMCFFSCFYIRVINETGAFNAGLCNLIKTFGNKRQLMIPVIVVIISLAGYSYGEAEDIYPLIPLFVATSQLAGYSDVIGIAISGGAVMLGFSASAFNPYTVGVAQKIAELPLYSGALFRTVIYVIVITLYVMWIYRYNAKTEKDTLLEGSCKEDMSTSKIELTEFSGRHKVILSGFALIVFLMVFGALKYGWYFTEISALFIIGGLITCVYMGYSPVKVVELLIGGMSDILLGVVVIGLARSILIIMTDAYIIDTIIYALFNLVAFLPKMLFPIGMLVVQTLINFIIPSGSGQAATVMPIMIPLADLLGVNRQVAVLAFQMGDGFSNLIWPTAGISIMCSIANVPLQRWYKFFMPFFTVLFLVLSIFLLIANALNYGPF